MCCSKIIPFAIVLQLKVVSNRFTHGIAPTILKLDLWSPGVAYYIHQGHKLDQERKIVKEKKILCIQKDLINFLYKRWVQFRKGVITRLPIL